MCQIIGIKTTPRKLTKLILNQEYLNIFQDILSAKGGDYYSATTTSSNGLIYSYSHRFSIDDVLKRMSSRLVAEEITEDDDIGIILFSRQQPEMESGSVEEQPYIHKLPNDSFNTFAVHGTIHNDKILSLKYKGNIQADTEILKYIPVSDWDKAEGTFCCIGLSPSGNLSLFNHGLKIWTNNIIDKVQDHPPEFLAEIHSTTNLDIFNNRKIGNSFIERPNQILYASFSGGMDISLSLYHTLKTRESFSKYISGYKKVVLNYFAWGSKAESIELGSVKKLVEFYKKNFPNIVFELNIIDSGIYFDEYFRINKAPLPKISRHNIEASIEDHLETESPLAYVPYRNTQFAILLASMAEAESLIGVDFLFGLNLSEGMVFMDNSEGWLESISEVIKYGGKDFKISGTYRVIAPYYDRTKTNMISEFAQIYTKNKLMQILGMTESCYYPLESGESCKKCGSCLLREKAYKNLNKDTND